MSDSDRRYEVEIYPFGVLDLERIPEDLPEGVGENPVQPRMRPVPFSMDVIHRLIERLQDL